MNLLDAWVQEIKSEPYVKYDRWWVDVVYTCEGILGFTSLMCKSRQEADEIKVGHKFTT